MTTKTNTKAAATQDRPTTDPLRIVWRAYCGQVAMEGVLAVLGGMLALIGIDKLIYYFTGFELGVWIFLFVAALGYLAFIGIFRPLMYFGRAHEKPRTGELIKVLPMVIPAIAEEGMPPAQMREVLSQHPPRNYLVKSRMIRNAIVFIIGLLIFLVPFFL